MTDAVLTRYEIDVEDVEYLRHGAAPLLARVYKPRGTGPFPLIVDLHGGAWCKKDRTSDAGTDEPLAKSGVVVVALDFRMPPDGGISGLDAGRQLRDTLVQEPRRRVRQPRGHGRHIGRFERRASGDARGHAPGRCALCRAAVAGQASRGCDACAAP